MLTAPWLWVECIVGAMEESDYIDSFAEVGFQDIRRIDQLDYFSGGASESTRKVAEGFGATSITIFGKKG